MRRLLALPLALLTVVPQVAFADWTTYNHDPARTGAEIAAPAPTGIAAAWTAALDGPIYGEALVNNGMVYVATENNSVYAIYESTGVVKWQQPIGNAVPQSSLPCGNINPVGITGTPVIDPATNALYVVALQGDGGNHYVMYSIALSLGNLIWGKNVDPPGFDASAQGQRGALVLHNGVVYTAFGGRAGDCGTYHGWVIGVSEDSSLEWAVQANSANGGGIWASSGLAADFNGIYTSTGNTTGCPSVYDRSNTVFRYTATLAEVDHWAPSNWAALSCSDTDINSVGPSLVDFNQLFQIGKNGIGYLIDRTGMTGVGGTHTELGICSSAFGGNAYDSPYLYIPCNDGIHQVQVGRASLTAGWTNGVAHHTPIVAGGMVWTIGGGHVYGISEASGQTVYTSPGTMEAPRTSFPAPSYSDGLVFAPGATHLYAFRVASPIGPTCCVPGPPPCCQPWTGGSVAVGATAGSADAFFAEGFTGLNFQEYLTVQNLDAGVQPLQVTYFPSSGPPIIVNHSLPGNARTTINVNQDVGFNQQVGAHLHTLNGTPFVAERPMYFDYNGWTGGDDVLGVPAPGTRFYFAEGYTGTGFEEFLTLLNPGMAPANVSITFYFNSGSAPKTVSAAVAAQSRYTIHVNDPAYAGPNQEVSMLVTSSAGIVAERPMYFNYQGVWTGGHVVMGAPAPQIRQFLAEGYVNVNFHEFLTVLNPDPVNPASVTFSFLGLGGGSAGPTAHLLVPAGSRRTLRAADYVAPGTSFSVDALSDVPVLVERPMYFNYQGRDGGHDTVALPQAGQRSTWYLAEGYVSDSFDEYVTIENPNSNSVSVAVTFLLSNASPPVTVTLNMAPQSRSNVFVNAVLPARTASSVRVVANGGPTGSSTVFVERPMYFAYSTS